YESPVWTPSSTNNFGRSISTRTIAKGMCSCHPAALTCRGMSRQIGWSSGLKAAERRWRVISIFASPARDLAAGRLLHGRHPVCTAHRPPDQLVEDPRADVLVPLAAVLCGCHFRQIESDQLPAA